MWILDRQRYWSFIKAYLVCFTALVGLYVVIDAFSNIDEFTKVEDGVGPLLWFMGKYYLVRASLFYDRLCGVITMLAAIFTVTWLQRNNEHLAILAAGVSTHRAIRPVLVAAVAVNLLAVANQELVIPRVAGELQKTPDDDGNRPLMTVGYRDVNGINIASGEADRASVSVKDFDATFSTNRFGSMFRLNAPRARYIPPDDKYSALRGGWLVRGGDLIPPDATPDGEILARIDPDPTIAVATAGAAVVVAEAAVAALPTVTPDSFDLAEGTYFFRTNVDFATVTQNRQWYQFASTQSVLRALKDPTYISERPQISVYLHARLLRPLLALALLALSLPMVLSGQNRNMFINLGISLGISAFFYIGLFVMQYLGGEGVVDPMIAAWGPLILFGTAAAANWGRIRT